ncbi:hypothetical protein PV10_00938 [Exophiala mesophila]|uniref:Endonuclease III homolog n=1 Tax=Exophiala mesophila TaxID=212818 RepID=A0A0D1Y905_EXOME|nr:uncharacterized protein PV10_00938 [Exophiala mesophila]KIV97156.1 hypothetical protein PV10_00938 [Exophiala mesophila]
MRTSKISQDTTRIFSAISPNTLGTSRSTRSAKRIASFALGYKGEVEVKEEPDVSNITNDLSIYTNTPDIEDVLPKSSPARVNRKRKLGVEDLNTSTTLLPPVAVDVTHIKSEVHEEDITTTALSSNETTTIQYPPLKSSTSPSPPRARSKARPKIPARRAISPTTGETKTTPPSNWAEIYSIVQAMRERNPTAPVDTMGCEDLYWRTAPEKVKRYHTLTALMLSSQTKDTVTAVAMQRLHTELVPSDSDPDSDPQTRPSTLTIDNIIATPPTHLDSLISKVGFHNNKTRFIKATALILRDNFSSDIPSTISELTSLPGVGPKMAYLCMSAAWGIDQGIGVDVHVHRITNLWGWHKTKNPEETRLMLQSWLPKDKWHHINKMLVGLGQTVCLPVGRRCGECDLAGTGLCKAEVKGWKPKTEKPSPGKGRVKLEVKLET